MATLPETAEWVGVYQLEESDPVLGGAPNEATGAGMDNIPHLHLAKRTSWLKVAVDTLAAQVAALSASVVAASTTVAGIVRLNNTLTSTATDQALTAAQGKALNDAKAPKNSPAFTGEPTAPTPPEGDNTVRIATTSWVRGSLEAMLAERIYTSPEVLIANGTAYTFAHGLGAIPARVSVHLICVNAGPSSAGYAVGDVIEVAPGADPDGSAEGISIRKSATTLVVRIGGNGPTEYINKNSGSGHILKAADWAMQIRAYKD